MRLNPQRGSAVLKSVVCVGLPVCFPADPAGSCRPACDLYAEKASGVTRRGKSETLDKRGTNLATNIPGLTASRTSVKVSSNSPSPASGRKGSAGIKATHRKLHPLNAAKQRP
jgi:hypothetical protein